VLRFPSGNVGWGEAVVAVLRDGFADVDDDRGANELVDRDLVDRLLALAKVDRSIEMRASVLARGVAAGGIPVALRITAPAFLFPREGPGRRPVDGLVVEGVGQVDQLGLVDCGRRRGDCEKD
jgi:hypothetical protein